MPIIGEMSSPHPLSDPSAGGLAAASAGAQSARREARALLARRIKAALIDMLLLALAFGFIAAVSGGIHSTTTSANGTTSVQAGASVHGGAALLFFLALFAYYAGCELRWGQTPGKRLMRLRVLTLDGRPPTTRAVLIRTAARLIDVLPVFYLVGLIALLLGSEDQRIGDRLAGTTVSPA
jgi:uncharacterized RDD family membrane protein YckC